MLLSLGAALFVVIPVIYRYRAASLTDRRSAYTAMLRRKSRGLWAALICFGLAMLSLAALIGLLLWARLPAPP